MPTRTRRRKGPPPRVYTGERMYRRYHLIDKPTMYGWHVWDFTDDTCRYMVCTGCRSVVPAWAVNEGFWRVMAGERCRTFLRALTR